MRGSCASEGIDPWSGSWQRSSWEPRPLATAPSAPRRIEALRSCSRLWSSLPWECSPFCPSDSPSWLLEFCVCSQPSDPLALALPRRPPGCRGPAGPVTRSRHGRAFRAHGGVSGASGQSPSSGLMKDPLRTATPEHRDPSTSPGRFPNWDACPTRPRQAALRRRADHDGGCRGGLIRGCGAAPRPLLARWTCCRRRAGHWIGFLARTSSKTYRFVT